MDEKWEIDRDNKLLPVLENAGGGTIEVTQGGEVIATVTPKPKHDVAKAQAAVERLLSLKVDLKLEPGQTIKDLINEGRRY